MRTGAAAAAVAVAGESGGREPPGKKQTTTTTAATATKKTTPPAQMMCTVTGIGGNLRLGGGCHPGMAVAANGGVMDQRHRRDVPPVVVVVVVVVRACRLGGHPHEAVGVGAGEAGSRGQATVAQVWRRKSITLPPREEGRAEVAIRKGEGLVGERARSV